MQLDRLMGQGALPPRAAVKKTTVEKPSDGRKASRLKT
jgi:hypothetical protein